MGWSDCAKCWDTPCSCGHSYRDWSHQKLRDQIEILQKVLLAKDPEPLVFTSSSNSVHLNGLRLERTCGVCPEQYNVWDHTEQVGYIRIRHGVLRVRVPHSGGTLVYQTEDIKGDGSLEDEERRPFLIKAVEAIKQSRKENSPCSIT
jgi:hypothetical protein